MPRSLSVGSILGISIGIHWTWLLVFGLVIWSLAATFFPTAYAGWSIVTYWATATVSAALLLASVLIHELGQALIARSRGLPVRNLTLFVFGGVSNVQEQVKTPASELLLAGVGPLISVALGVLFSFIYLTLQGVSEQMAAIVVTLGVGNLLIGLLNLVPGLPLDGGRLLRSILWFLSESRERATRVALQAGRIVGWGLVVAGFVIGMVYSLLGGAWLVLGGWCVASVSGPKYLAVVRDQEGGRDDGGR